MKISGVNAFNYRPSNNVNFGRFKDYKTESTVYNDVVGGFVDTKYYDIFKYQYDTLKYCPYIEFSTSPVTGRVVGKVVQQKQFLEGEEGEVIKKTMAPCFESGSMANVCGDNIMEISGYIADTNEELRILKLDPEGRELERQKKLDKQFAEARLNQQLIEEEKRNEAAIRGIFDAW